MTARLHAVEDGPAGAPVLVLGPSLGTDTGLFDSQVADLAGTHRVVRYDLRGHGGSQVLPGPCTIADLTRDVLALLDDLDVDRFSYAGVSIGGAIGQQLALTVPDRLDRLAVIASAARFADPPSWAVRAAQVREQGTGVLVPSRTGTWFTAEWAEREPAADEVVAGARGPVAARAPTGGPRHRPPDPGPRSPRERVRGRSARPVRTGTGHRAWRTPG